MPDRTDTAARQRPALVLLMLLGMGACSTSSKLEVMMFADPGKYEYHTCEQILASGRAAAEREEKLRVLIERAEQTAGGSVVSTVAYRGEYRTLVEELAVIETVARRKNCLTPNTWRSNTAIQ